MRPRSAPRPSGDFADEEEAVRFAQAEAPEGVKIEANRRRHGELCLQPTAGS
jgi:hypothetical protein